jgi:MFS family permease
LIRLNSVIPDLPRRTWILLAGDTFSAIGNGMILPFTIIYLHRVRGFEIEIAALTLSFMSIVGLAAGPIAGTLIDRLGSRRVLLSALFISMAGSFAFIPVREPWQGFVAAGISGAGLASFWPSIQALLSQSVQSHQRSAVFSVHYAALNLGIGIGGITGGFVADISVPITFQRLYVVDAVTFIPFMLLLATVLRGMGSEPTVVSEEETVSGSYAQVFKDRVFVRVWLLMVLLVTVGYSQLESSFPAFATGAGGVGTEALGVAFAGNTFFIVISQLIVLKRVEGKRRTDLIFILCVVWGLCWAVTLASGALDAGWAQAGFLMAMVVFAFGETLLSPTIPAIVNDLAPDELRGRYNAVYTLAWSAGSIIGPALAGLFLGAGLAGLFFSGLIVLCVGAGLFGLSLRRHLLGSANIVSEETSPA